MSSLTSVVRLLEAFSKIGKDEPNTFSANNLEDCNRGGNSSQWNVLGGFDSWQGRQLAWLHHNALSPVLDNMCAEVAKHLVNATRRTQILQDKFSDNTSYPQFHLERHYLVLQALDDVIGALKGFEAVAHDRTLQAPGNFKLIKEYFRSVLELSIMLGRLLDCGGKYEPWFVAFEGEISNEFKTFRFDSLETDFGQLDNPHLSGTIMDPSGMPVPFLPFYPDGPYLVPSGAAYGPSIILNRPD